MKTPPTKVSELIALALHDLELTEKDPDYIIRMSVWHEIGEEDKKCEVCLAGAIIAQTLKVNKSTRVFTSWNGIFDGITKEWSDALLDLNQIRKGHLSRDAYAAYIYLYKDSREDDHYPYDVSPEGFKSFMKRVKKAYELVEEKESQPTQNNE